MLLSRISEVRSHSAGGASSCAPAPLPRWGPPPRRYIRGSAILENARPTTQHAAGKTRFMNLPRSCGSEVQLADERLHQRPPGRAFGRVPVAAPRNREETLLVEIFLEHVEALGEQPDRLLAIQALLEHRDCERRVPQ